MTSRQKITYLFILLVATWTAILYFFVTIYKTEVWFLDINPFYSATICGLYFLTIIYSHFCVTKKILLNIALTTSIFIVIHPLDIKLVDSLTTYLIKLDKNQTPLGWTFRFRWADIVLTNIFSLILLSLTTKLLPTKWWRFTMANDSTILPDKYRLKFFIEYGAGSLWPDNEPAFKKFDLGPLDETIYNLDGKVSRQPKIKLPDNLESKRQQLIDMYKESFDQNDITAGPSLWTIEQRTNFYSQTKKLYIDICEFLGENFEVIYNQDEN